MTLRRSWLHLHTPGEGERAAEPGCAASLREVLGLEPGVGVQRAWDLLYRVLDGPEVRGIAGWLVGEAEVQGDACMGGAALPKGEGRGPANGARRMVCPIVPGSQLK